MKHYLVHLSQLGDNYYYLINEEQHNELDTHADWNGFFLEEMDIEDIPVFHSMSELMIHIRENNITLDDDIFEGVMY